MRFKGRRQSDNVEDRRGVSPGKAAAGGGLGLVVVAIIVLLLGGDPSALLNAAQAPSRESGPVTRSLDPAEEELRELVSVTLADTEEVWSREFSRRGMTYQEPKLVLFRDRVESACGLADSAIGPFYCGGDQTVYIDLSFFRDLRDRFGARGDFAQAYVVAHEVGHHVQNLLGTMRKVQEAQRRTSERQSNDLSVRLELQADYYAGVWAHHARDMAGLDRSDIEEGIEAAEAIGDDAIQKKAQGYVVPDSFTHGSSQQRVRWFLHGFKSGKMEDGDTFKTAAP
jgi:predicted metalloprotease